jgi:hypothetical protein
MDGDEVVTALSTSFGLPSPDNREQFVPLDTPSGDNIYGDALDGLGAVSEFPFYRVACWEALCVEMDSTDGENWVFATWHYGPSGLTGWEALTSDASPLLMTSSGITIGTTFGELRAKHPDVTVYWGEGGSIGFTLPGWEPLFNGAVIGTGMLDYNVNLIRGFAYDEVVPDQIPDDVVVQALFVGDGVDYGCC